MSKRKPNNSRARLERSLRAVLSSHHVSVVQIDPQGKQGLMNWKNCKSIPHGQRVADAVCDLAHRWTIYLSAFCIDQRGERYLKSTEIAPHGNYLAAHITDVLEEHYRALIATCNPMHVIGSGWVAIPTNVSLTEEQAAAVFKAAGAWNQQEQNQ